MVIHQGIHIILISNITTTGFLEFLSMPYSHHKKIQEAKIIMDQTESTITKNVSYTMTASDLKNKKKANGKM
jgi:hypothetical protein